MRYLSLSEALVVAEVVTGIDARTLSRASRVDLLDSALHGPQAGFGDEEFYPSIVEKAAVLAVRIARNHPLPDGNKRLAWQSLTIFLALNGHRLEVGTEQAVGLMLGVAAGELDEAAVAEWLRQHLEPTAPDDK
ncbi:MAG: type II toxin-antitoxin system death-on-curing family toxin [Microthrixaceae bacterium]|nr:type II toxin-antitoxin system death-on-curing family toxin [Microthrixaceae bacterium]